MSTLTHDRNVGIGGAAALAALALAAMLGMQWARGGWPFESAAHPERAERVEGPAPQTGHEGHGAPAAAAGQGSGTSSPAGYAPVTVEPARLPALALSVATVEERPLKKTLRTVGSISFDETRTAHVHSRVRGWIDGIAVNFVGKEVKAGDVLCTIYSQEVYAAEIELLATPQGPLLEAARKRLRLWDVPQSEIARLERTREPRRSFPLLAPRAGTVVAKQALQGMYVDASVELYTLSDLSRVWVQADVYEAEVAKVRPGSPATLRVEGLEAPVVAEVTFVAPTLDEATRTRKVRFELPNPERALLPGAFVAVELGVDLGSALAVPEDAVILTGTRAIVFVAHGEPPTHFEPREVKLGPLVGDQYRVDAGLKAGERVATGAQFLLDSESRLRASSVEGGGNAHAH